MSSSPTLRAILSAFGKYLEFLGHFLHDFGQPFLVRANMSGGKKKRLRTDVLWETSTHLKEPLLSFIPSF